MHARWGFRTVYGALVLWLASGCGTAGLSRTVTDEASTFLTQKVDFYEADADKQRFASLKLSSDKLINTFKGALSKENHPKFEHDPRLDAVAHLYASAIGEDGTWPSNALVDWALRKLGVAANLHDSHLNWSAYYNPNERLSVSLRKFAMDYEAKGEKYRFGLARFEVASGKWAQAAIVVEELATISEIPKEVQPGQTLLLRGKIHGKNKGAYLHLQLPGTNRMKLTLPLNDDGKFLVKVPMPATPGRYWMEVLVDREPRSNDTALSMPLYVGIEEPSSPPPEVVDPAPNPPKMADWPAAVLALYNEARARAHMPALVLDPALAKIAQQQADLWLERRSRPWLPFSQLTFEKGALITNYWSRSIGTDNLADAVRSDLDSADGARVILDQRRTHIGIGVAPLTDEERDLVRIVQIAGTPDSAPPEPAELLSNLPAPVTRYASDELQAAAAPWDNEARALASSIAASAKVEVRYDPSLNALAEYRARHGEIPDYVDMWMLSWAGCIGNLELSRHRKVIDNAPYPWFALEAQQGIIDDDDYKSKRYRMGLSRVHTEDGQEIEAMVLVKDELELAPFAKRYRPGEPIVLTGRFLAKPQFPRVLLDRQGADILAWDIDVDADGDFRLELPAPKDPGLHLLEVAVRPLDFDPDDLLILEWNQDVLLVPIYVDVEETVRLSQLPFAWRKAESAPSSWAEELLTSYNDLRAQYGLPSLRRSPAMDSMVAARLYRKQYTYDVPSLFRLGQQAYGEGLGVPIRGGSFDGWHLPMQLAFERLLPSARRSLLSPDAVTLALAVDKEGESMEKVLFSPALPQRLTAKGKTGAFRPVEALNDRLSKANRLALRAATAKKDALLECYLEDLSCFNKFDGRVTLELVISGHGEIVGVRPSVTTLENEKVERCMADELIGTKAPSHVTPQLMVSEVTVVLGLGNEKSCKYEGKISFE